MKRTQSVALFVLAAIALIALVPVHADADTSTVKVVNQSRFDIHHFFLSPADTNQWGPDWLGDHVLGNGGSLTLTGVDCDVFDVRLVDEDGDECIVGGVEICDEDQVWEITTDDLLDCEGFE